MIQHPSLIYVLGALVVLFVHSRTRQLIQLFVPLAALYLVFTAYDGSIKTFSIPLQGQIWALMRLDTLAFLFVLSFLIFSFMANLFSLHTGSRTLFAASGLYIGAAVGAVLAGDLRILFVFWEIMAIASAVLVWNPLNKASGRALYRYLLMHGLSGLLFLASIVLKLQAGQSLETGSQEMDLSGVLLFCAFAVNAALVPVHTWLPDAYSAATPSGSVYLSAFTTKTAVYAFARMFPGEELLLVLGAIAAIYGIIYALMENDIRRLLSYSTICQIGYMAAGIGLGTTLSISAGAGHAAGNIFFKGLLFMAAGSVIMITGHSTLTTLGGIASKKKFLFVLFAIGALALAGIPLLPGYITKSLLLLSASKSHTGWLELLLLTASIGTFLAVVLKMGFFLFLGKRNGTDPVQPLPWNCYAAMTLAAVLCLITGVFPELLYALLPGEIGYNVYTPDHLLQSLEWAAGSLLVFLIFFRLFKPKSLRAMDFDALYNRAGSLILNTVSMPLKAGHEKFQGLLSVQLQKSSSLLWKKIPKQGLSPSGYALLWIVAGFLFSTGAFFFSGK